VRVRTLRRDPIDFDALARAALEHAAMNQAQDHERDTESPAAERSRRREQRVTNRSKEPRHDRLA
jgi:hypothetical protein